MASRRPSSPQPLPRSAPFPTRTRRTSPPSAQRPPATANRDAAVKSLNTGAKQFNKIAGVVLKNYPDLGKKRSVTTSRRPVKDS